MKYSIILVNHSKPQSSLYGYYSWLLQNCLFEYEVIVLYCDERENYYKRLMDNKVRNCDVRLFPIKQPKYFHLGSFRNLGVYYAKGDNLIVASIDIVRRSNFIEMVELFVTTNCLSSVGSFHILDHTKYLGKFSQYDDNKNFDRIVNKVSSDFKHQHTIDYGTFIVRREHFLNVGGYDNRLYFHEDVGLDIKFNNYFKEKGVKEPIIRLKETELFGGFKCKGDKKLGNCSMHGMVVSKPYKSASMRLIETDFWKDSTKPMRMDEVYLKKKIHRNWPSEDIINSKYIKEPVPDENTNI